MSDLEHIAIERFQAASEMSLHAYEYEFIRYAIVGVICFWLGIVLATWYLGRRPSDG